MSCISIDSIADRIVNRDVCVEVPGSKSITNRALLMAALCDGECRLSGVLFSDDTRHFISCLRSLGFEVQADEAAKTVSVRGMGGRIPFSEAAIDVGSAGTAARFLSALLGVIPGRYTVNASEQMKKRPMKPLIEVLRSLGAQVTCSQAQDALPFEIAGNGAANGEVCVDIDKSSQFLSALLISAVCLPEGLRIRTVGSHGMSYIEMTVKMMAQFGVRVKRPAADTFIVPARQHYTAMDYHVEPDMSGAAYFYAAGALLGVKTTVKGVRRGSLQGDEALFDVLGDMGALVVRDDNGVSVCGAGLHGVDVDMSACSDQAITVAVLAAFADSPTRIRGIGHIRYQESDRIEAIVTELGRMGIRTKEFDDGIEIYPGEVRPAHIKTYNDHRIAMGFALAGLECPGMVIEDKECVGKTFENYFEVLEEFCGKVTNNNTKEFN